ncbi:LysR family transcriptional regulator [Bdellovibrio svalbardensis]|uniref:LysR family transcriptional regulator n=1 Tax=Bdellovibrio svalbardensis TaxID=2972972 RepID=A0ABT6DK81_9BACT|nr:LysR family transcriptional regulator [Bdellovibrio svalbardensis]MDG0817213.1 LysR family transcriptional regulator [Bdellovibrio svalbardensis]
MKPENLNLNALKYFVDTVELGSFSQAAEKNHVSRPAISQSILRLEDSIGFALLNHKRKAFALTEEGHSFYHKAKKSLALVSEIFSSPSSDKAGLKIGCSATLAEFLIIPNLEKFTKSTQTELQIQFGTTAKVRQLIADDEINLGFLIDDGSTFEFQTVPLFEGHFVLLSKSGELANPVVTTFARPETLQLQQHLHKRKQTVKRVQIDSWKMCHHFAASNSGTCLVPDLLPGKTLKPVSLPGFKPTYKVLAVMKNRNLLSESEQRLLKELEMKYSK